MTERVAPRTALLTTCALGGFAANSVLCRLALSDRAIDAASFTAVRLGAGAVTLALLSALAHRGRGPRASGAGWRSALSLFAYAAAFSFAYRKLDTGVGALILFAMVQVTMLGFGLLRGERPSPRQWLGVSLALGGLVGLTAPGLRAPEPLGAMLMALSGVAWGVYSIRGKGVADPLAATAGNFARSTVPAAALLALHAGALHFEPRGVLLAVASGAIASGVAYSIWYAALRHLPATRAAVVQLSVPVLAAAAGVALLAEPITARLLLAGGAILLGVALAVV